MSAPSALKTSASPMVATIIATRKPMTRIGMRRLTRSPRTLRRGDPRRPDSTRGATQSALLRTRSSQRPRPRPARSPREHRGLPSRRTSPPVPGWNVDLCQDLLAAPLDRTERQAGFGLADRSAHDATFLTFRVGNSIAFPLGKSRAEQGEAPQPRAGSPSFGPPCAARPTRCGQPSKARCGSPASSSISSRAATGGGGRWQLGQGQGK